MPTISDRISNLLSELSTNPTSIDINSISSLLSEIRETIGKGLERATSEKGLSQPGAALTQELNEKDEKIKNLENSLSSFKALFDHLKDILSGKVKLVYKDSKLRDDILADIASEKLSIEAFLKLQSQIEYLFNSQWFSPEKSVSLSANPNFIPANYKSGGNPWQHA